MKMYRSNLDTKQNLLLYEHLINSSKCPSRKNCLSKVTKALVHLDKGFPVTHLFYLIKFSSKCSRGFRLNTILNLTIPEKHLLKLKKQSKNREKHDSLWFYKNFLLKTDRSHLPIRLAY